MLFSDRDICEALHIEAIVCEPLLPNNISDTSIDLTLADIIVKQSSGVGSIRFDIDDSGKLTVIYPDCVKNVEKSLPYTIYPNEFILASTVETIGSHKLDIACQLFDKSTLARLGLSICFNAGIIEPGNILKPTLEIRNNGHMPIVLMAGMHICQVRFLRCDSPAFDAYSGKYQNDIIAQVAV